MTTTPARTANRVATTVRTVRFMAQWPWLAAIGVLLAPVGVVLFVTVAATGQSAPDTVESAEAVGMDPILLDAFNRATRTAPEECGMRWSILAGITQVESNLAAGHTVHTDGTITPPIIGPRLDGTGAGGNTTPITDHDHGRWDDDTDFDHAVGPMQFIPTTWSSTGRDGNDDDQADPHNIYDAAVTATAYLCDHGRHLADPDQLRAAIRAYNNSDQYVSDVTGWIDRYDALGATVTGGQPGVGATGDARRVLDAARGRLGDPYEWGGESPGHFDCSGLTKWAYATVGITLPHHAADQYQMGTHIPASQGIAALAPGDLTFWSYDGTPAGIHHVALYVGGGNVIQAPDFGDVVKISPLWLDGYIGATRLLT